MLRVDRDALVCDMAETYHIYDLRAVPAFTLATLAAGLRDDSRIKMAMAGLEYIPPALILARIADNTSLISYGLTADKTAPAPQMVMDLITGGRRVAERNQSEGQRAVFALIEEDVKRRMEGKNV